MEVEQSIRGSKQEKIKFLNTDLSIEHILPQTWYEYWPLNNEYVTEEDFYKSIHAVMTEEDKEGKYHMIEKRNAILHTLGNLTILTTSLNPSVSNSYFDIKKREIANQSTLVLNTYFNDKPDWSEDAIAIRGKTLYEKIKTIWPY